MKKICVFVAAIVAAFSAIGCVGYSVYDGNYLLAVGSAILAAFAFPTIKKGIGYSLS